MALARDYLKRKPREYEALKAEIESLRAASSAASDPGATNRATA